MVDPQTQVGCTPDDLYAARCGLLHSGSAESRLSREGKASPLWYVTDRRKIPLLQEFAQRKGATAKTRDGGPTVDDSAPEQTSSFHRGSAGCASITPDVILIAENLAERA